MERESKPNYYNSAYHNALYNIFLSYLNGPFEKGWLNSIKRFESEEIILLRKYLSEENIQAGHHLTFPGLMPVELDGIFREIIQQSDKHLSGALADYHRYHKLLEGPGVGFEYSPYFDIAFEAVWGGVYFRSCEKCWYNDPFMTRTATEKKQCHECDRQAFIKMVDAILCKGSFDSLFDEILMRRNQFVRSYVFKTCERLHEMQVFHAADYFRETPPSEYVFSRFILGLVGFSFISFIQDYDESVKNLKQCPYCGLFFIAKDQKRQHCYDAECVKTYRRNKKREQREVDPVKYNS